MNNNHDHNDGGRPVDAELDRHVDTLLAEPTPDGPSPDALGRTLAMFATPGASRMRIGGAADASPQTLSKRFTMTFAQRLYAVAALAAAACVLYFGVFLFSATGGRLAFADVAGKIAAAKSLAYTTTVAVPGGGPSISTRTVCGDAGRARVDLPGGNVMIRNGPRIMMLDPKAKTATLTEGTGGPKAGPTGGAPTPTDLVGAFKQLGGSAAKPTADRTIDGVVAAGFEAPWAGDGTMTVWADKKTATPLRIELTMKAAGQTVTAVIDRFEIDPPVNDAMFSTDAPAGYAVTRQTIDLKAANMGRPAEAVAGVLKAYAAASGGTFPGSLNDWSALTKADAAGKPLVDPTAVGTMSAQLMSLKGGYGYAGKDVKLGDKDALLFWYRPEGATAYRAVFGDLRVEDVAEARLPATKPADERR